MPTIIKRGANYLVRVRKTGFRPVSQTFIRRVDAVAWGRRVEADMQSGRWRPAGESMPSLRVAIVEYRLKIATRLKGARDYQYAFREIEDSPLGDLPLDKLKPSDLAEWRDALASRGLKPATVARRLGLLSGILSWCHKEKNWIVENPMRSVRKRVGTHRRALVVRPSQGLGTPFAAHACAIRQPQFGAGGGQDGSRSSHYSPGGLNAGPRPARSPSSRAESDSVGAGDRWTRFEMSRHFRLGRVAPSRVRLGLGGPTCRDALDSVRVPPDLRLGPRL